MVEGAQKRGDEEGGICVEYVCVEGGGASCLHARALAPDALEAAAVTRAITTRRPRRLDTPTAHHCIRHTPHRSLRYQGGARSVSGTGGSRALAPRLSIRSSSSGVPPVVLGSHDLDCCAVRWKMLGVDRGAVVPSRAFRAAARVNGR